MTLRSEVLTILSVGRKVFFNNFKSLKLKESGIQHEKQLSNEQCFSKELYMRWFILFSLMIAAYFIATPTHAQDVYNFYFNKSTPAAGITPGLGPSPVTPSPVNSATENKLEAQIPSAEKKLSELAKWEILVGRSHIVSKSSTQTYVGPIKFKDEANFGRNAYSLFGAYRFNKFVSGEAALYLGIGDNDAPDHIKKNGGDKTIDGSLGLALVPFHLNVFGYEFLELGVTAGIMSVNHYVLSENENMEIIDTKTNKKTAGFIGPRLGLNLTPSLSAVIESKLASSESAQISTVGLRYRF